MVTRPRDVAGAARFPLPAATFHGEEQPSDRSVRTGRSAR